jgi:hypothetical protein
MSQSKTLEMKAFRIVLAVSLAIACAGIVRVELPQETPRAFQQSMPEGGANADVDLAPGQVEPMLVRSPKEVRSWDRKTRPMRRYKGSGVCLWGLTS